MILPVVFSVLNEQRPDLPEAACFVTKEMKTANQRRSRHEIVIELPVVYTDDLKSRLKSPLKLHQDSSVETTLIVWLRPRLIMRSGKSTKCITTG